MRLGPIPGQVQSDRWCTSESGRKERAVRKQKGGRNRGFLTMPMSLLKEEREGERGENQTEVSYFVLKYAIFLLRK